VSVAGLAAALLLFVTMGPGDSPLSGEYVADQWHRRLDDRYFTADVRMEVDLGGLREERRMRVYRDDVGEGERIMIRFEAPADLRNVGLLYLERAGQPNDYFLYQPALRRIRRLPETVADDDVYGIDLEFLGFGVAQVAPTVIRDMTEETLDGRPAYKIVETAKVPNRRFDRRTTWIDAATFVPLRTEHLRDGRVVLIAETLEIAKVQRVHTPKRMRFTKPIEKREVLLFVDSVDYEASIPEEYFSAMTLVKSALGK
jgi:hypothetical protein